MELLNTNNIENSKGWNVSSDEELKNTDGDGEEDQKKVVEEDRSNKIGASKLPTWKNLVALFAVTGMLNSGALAKPPVPGKWVTAIPTTDKRNSLTQKYTKAFDDYVDKYLGDSWENKPAVLYQKTSFRYGLEGKAYDYIRRISGYENDESSEVKIFTHSYIQPSYSSPNHGHGVSVPLTGHGVDFQWQQRNNEVKMHTLKNKKSTKVSSDPLPGSITLLNIEGVPHVKTEGGHSMKLE